MALQCLEQVQHAGLSTKALLVQGLGGEGMSPDPQHCAGVGCQAARDDPLVLLPITPCSSLQSSVVAAELQVSLLRRGCHLVSSSRGAGIFWAEAQAVRGLRGCWQLWGDLQRHCWGDIIIGWCHHLSSLLDDNCRCFFSLDSTTVGVTTALYCSCCRCYQNNHRHEPGPAC